jgi:hypothetical protein
MEEAMKKLIALGTFFTLALAATASAAAGTGNKTIDPCTVAPPAQLGVALNSALAMAFPLTWSQPGKKLTLSNPELLNTTCAPLRIDVRAHIHYKDTRGLDQGSASGQVRFAASVLANVSYNGSTPITSSNFVSADACISSINVLGLNINHVPNWLDNGWMRSLLQEKLGSQHVCKSITPFVAAYLASGHSIP